MILRVQQARAGDLANMGHIIEEATVWLEIVRSPDL
jgi:hypothetical protein